MEFYIDDFLEHKYKNMIHSAKVIFCINCAFSPETKNKLKEVLAGCELGTTILTTKSFYDPKLIFPNDDFRRVSTVSTKNPKERMCWTTTEVDVLIYERVRQNSMNNPDVTSLHSNRVLEGNYLLFCSFIIYRSR